LAFDIAGFRQALAERGYEKFEGLGRTAIEGSNHRHRRLLRARGQRPCNYTGAEKPDEFPPPHGIYSLAENHLPESLIRSSSESHAPRCSKKRALMSAMGQKRTSGHDQIMSVLPPKADIAECVMGMLCAQKRTSIEAEGRSRAGCVLAIANGMTAEQEFPGRNPSSTQPPARSWLVPDSRGAHCLFGILARAESILPPLRDNHRELTLCSPT